MKDDLKKTKLINVLPYLVFVFLMVFVIFLKVDYHLDETLTYALSNHAGSYYMEPEEGIRYEPSTQPYVDYLGTTSIAPSSFWIP